MMQRLYGPLAFVAIVVVLTSISAAICVPAFDAIEPPGAMLRASLIYAAVVGWQPLAALALARRWCPDTRPFDDGIRPIAMRASLAAVAMSMFLLAAAVVLGGDLELAARVENVTWSRAIELVATFLATVTILWLQAVVEEVAWRGYVLPRLMRTLGTWPGLVVHGVLWGLCYAALFGSLAYVVTCSLLGTLLGWLRLVSRSIYASAASNATLTICAGLPMLLVGEPARFGAAFQPPGWLPMLAVLACIVAYRPWRTAIAIPWRPVPDYIN